MSTQYTLHIQNQSVSPQNYTIFAQRPGAEVYDEPWRTVANVMPGSFAAVDYQPKDGEEAPHFYINNIAYAAGEAIDHSSVASAPIDIDFAGQTQTATVIHQPNGAFFVSFA